MNFSFYIKIISLITEKRVLSKIKVSKFRQLCSIKIK